MEIRSEELDELIPMSPLLVLRSLTAVRQASQRLFLGRVNMGI